MTPSRHTRCGRILGTLVLPDRIVEGAVEVAGGVIADVEADVPASDQAGLNLREHFVVPGFVDIHVHGGGGASFDGGPEQLTRAVAYHRRHGTTSMLASVVSSSIESMAYQVSALAELVVDDEVAGVHLEGPFLNPVRRGAQPHEALRPPSVADLHQLVGRHTDAVRMMTIAPELPGGLELISSVTAQGIVAAVGHSDATARDARLAFDAGARVATHLFNGMAPMHHRSGGVAVAAMMDPRVVCEVVDDRHHLADEIVALAFRAAGRDRVALVTDAIASAGDVTGCHELGGQAVEVVDGAARLVESESLAGSLLTMDRAVRNAVAYSGVPLVDAVLAATLTPASAIGIADRVGSLECGKQADLCVLDSNLNVVAVMKAGRWIGDPPNEVARPITRTDAPRDPSEQVP